MRKGVPEVVYARGKTPDQVARICETLLESPERVIVSAPSPEHEAGSARRSLRPPPEGRPRPGHRCRRTRADGGRVGALSAGTSDLPVLEEALAVAREMGAAVRSFHDVGVAGIHRLAGPLEELRAFDPDCLIVAAGMEGALPSVVSGLVAVPVDRPADLDRLRPRRRRDRRHPGHAPDLLARSLRRERGQRRRRRGHRGPDRQPRRRRPQAHGSRSTRTAVRAFVAVFPPPRVREALSRAARDLPAGKAFRLIGQEKSTLP